MISWNPGIVNPVKYSKDVKIYSANPFRGILLTIPSFHTIPIELKVKPIEVLNSNLNNGPKVDNKIKYFNTVNPFAICLGNYKQLLSKGVTDFKIAFILFYFSLTFMQKYSYCFFIKIDN